MSLSSFLASLFGGDDEDWRTFKGHRGEDRYVENGKAVFFSSPARKEFVRQKMLKKGSFHREGNPLNRGNRN